MEKIYVSSSCVKTSAINESIELLVNNGFDSIELSGGTNYLVNIEELLIELKDKYNLTYLCHNYFPPPQKPFVLNLGSLNDEIYQLSLNHLKNAITLSKNLGADKFAFHAGFFIDIQVSQIGRIISRQKLFDKQKCIKRFCEGYEELLKHANGVNLYIENNVISYQNFANYNEQNILMFTNADDYYKLKKDIEFTPLLDLAHLKVSCNTLNLDFEEHCMTLAGLTDYIHLSDNDGKADQNLKITQESSIWNVLKKMDLGDKTITLEIYEDLATVKANFDLLMDL